MIQNLKPYPAYKNSGVPWLGEVPEHWEIKPLKRWVRINGEVLPETTSPDYEFQYIDIGAVGTGFLKQKPQRLRFLNAPSRARRVLRAGDTIVSTVRTYLKAVYFVKKNTDDLICSTGFVILTPRSGTEPKYISYYALSNSFTDRVTAESVGIAYPAIAEGRLGSFHVAIPPFPEQSAIVRFLDYVDWRIRRYIRSKRRLIELLNEQKQAIIHRVVTRGLDPNVRLKPSGIEWLGDVPEHWGIIRLKYVAKVQTGLTLGKTYDSATLETRPYLRVANVQDGYLDLKDIATVRVPVSEAKSCELRAGDVLMTEGGDIDKLGRGYIWKGEIPGCLHQNHIFAVRADHTKLLPEYLVMLMTSVHGRNYFQVTAKKTTNLASTNNTTLKAFPLFLPGVEEQQRLLDYIVKETSNLDRAIKNFIEEIDLIREYRTRLISDVVTGKLDVREAAEQLPDEIKDSEPFDGLTYLWKMMKPVK